MKKLIMAAMISASAVLSVGAITTVDMETGAPGLWNVNFAVSKAYCEANFMPMLVFWGSKGCPKCKALAKAVDEPAFIAWQNTRKIVMVFVEGEGTRDASDCHDFAKNPSGKFPYVSIYWLKADGTKVKQNFTGRSGSMPGTGSDLAEKLMNSVDMYIGGWDGSGVVVPTGFVPPSVAVGSEWNSSRKIYGALYANGHLFGSVEVKAGRRNSKYLAKVSAKVTTLDGKSRSFSAKTINVKSTQSVPLTKRSDVLNIDLSASLSGAAVIDGVSCELYEETLGGTRADQLHFFLSDDFPLVIDGLGILQEYLPSPNLIINAGKKWTTAVKAGKVKYDRTAMAFLPSNENPSGIKFTYKYKTGVFKGSFAAYAPKNEKTLKKFTVKFTGLYSEENGGYGLVTIGKNGPYACMITR